MLFMSLPHCIHCWVVCGRFLIPFVSSSHLQSLFYLSARFRLSIPDLALCALYFVLPMAGDLEQRLSPVLPLSALRRGGCSVQKTPHASGFPYSQALPTEGGEFRGGLPSQKGGSQAQRCTGRGCNPAHYGVCLWTP